MFFPLSWDGIWLQQSLFSGGTDCWNQLFQCFLEDNIYCSGLEHFRLQKENISADLLLPFLPWATDLQMFSGFWLFAILGSERFCLWMGRGEEGCLGQLSHPVVCLQGYTHISKAKLLACYLSHLLDPEQGFGMWQLLQKLTAKKSFARPALYAQQSLFTCVSSVAWGLPQHCDKLHASRGCLVSG